MLRVVLTGEALRDFKPNDNAVRDIFALAQYNGLPPEVQPKKCPSVIIVLLQTKIDCAIESSHDTYRDGVATRYYVATCAIP